MAASVKVDSSIASANNVVKPSGEVRYVKVFLHDGTMPKEGFYILTTTTELSDANLGQIRRSIAKSREQQEFATLSFCSRNGAIVPDTVLLSEYQEKILQTANETDKAPVIDVYLRKSADTLASPNGDALTYTPDPVTLSRLKAAFDDTAFKVITGTAAKYTAELEEQDWSIISENNALCFGTKLARKTVRTVVPDSSMTGSSDSTESPGVSKKVENQTLLTGVERAKFPAFRLKKRTLLSDRITSTPIKDVEMFLRIPDYIVDDQSYVTVYETTNTFQASLAMSSFSETDVSVSASGSAFGFSAEGSASYKQSGGDSTNAATTKASKQIILAYNFPRVTALLDKHSIELTPECEKALAKVVNIESLTKFLDKYGEFYSRRVQLGGRLFTSEEVDETSGETSKAMKRSMKAAASVSFSGSTAVASFGGSASVSHAADSSSNNSSMNANLLHTQTWQANGGDTLLCNDPRAWAASVAYHWNWRITMRDHVCHILEVIAEMPGWEDLPANVKKWTAKMTPPTPIKPQEFYLNLDGVENGRYLLTCDKKIKNLEDAAALFDADTTVNDKRIPIPHKYLDIGAALLGPIKKERNMEDLAFILKTKKGGLVSEPLYNTEYRIWNPKSQLYLSFDFHSRGDAFKNPYFPRHEWRFLCTKDTTPETIFVFRDSSKLDDDQNESPILDKASICIRAKESPKTIVSYWVCQCGNDKGEFVALEVNNGSIKNGSIKPLAFIFTKKNG